jgi:hypothetical protein
MLLTLWLHCGLLVAADDSSAQYGLQTGELLSPVAARTLQPALVVAVSPGASVPEHAAAKLLAVFGGRLAANGSVDAPPLEMVSPEIAAGRAQLAVGAAAVAPLGVLPAELAGLGAESFILSSNRTATLRITGSIALAAAPDSTTGVLYAAQQLLRLMGVRFFAWDETFVPRGAVLWGVPEVDLCFTPAFEYRDIAAGWNSPSNASQAQMQYFHLNGYFAKARPPSYQQSAYSVPPGFVHTSYFIMYYASNQTWTNKSQSNCSAAMCPPTALFEKHNEWL